MYNRSDYLPSTVSNKPVEDKSLVSNDFSTALGAIILSLVFLLGVPGNLFIIVSVLKFARRRSATTLFILNLACADGFLMGLTIFFVVYLVKQTWVFGTGMCKVVFYLCNINMYASIFLITLMSLQRLVAVVWPRKLGYLASKKIVRRAIAGLWVLVLFISIPALVFRELREDNDENNNTRLVCAPNHTNSENTNEHEYVTFHYTFETVVGFIVPYTIIVTSYVLILRRLRKTKFRRKVRSEKLILAIVVLFGIFWLPYHIINMIQVASEMYPDTPVGKRLTHIWKSSRAVTSALAFISSCVNPVLYTFAGKSYIKQNGLAFMARLFEGTSLDQSDTKRGRSIGGAGVRYVESATSSGVNAVQNRT